MNADQRFGQMLRIIRKMGRMSAREVGERAGISESYILAIESGSRRGKFDSLSVGYRVDTERLCAAFAEFKRQELASQSDEMKELSDFAAAVVGLGRSSDDETREAEE